MTVRLSGSGMNSHPTNACPRQDWTNSRVENVSKGSPNDFKVADLNPSSSYIFRLYVVTSEGQEIGPGPEVAFDTEGERGVLGRY